MADPILPTADELITPAIDAIVALRPESLAHFNSDGTWTNLTKMWRAQASLVLVRLADEVKSARLRFATGDALRTLAASEFNTSLTPGPQTALAVLFVQRPAPTLPVITTALANIGATILSVQRLLGPIATGTILQFAGGATATLNGNARDGDASIIVFALSASIAAGAQALAPDPTAAPTGIIKAGTRFTKLAQPDGIPLPPAGSPSPGNAYPLAISAATYVATAPVYIPTGGAVTASVAVPCVATSPGAAANIPTFAGGQYGPNGLTLIQPAAALYDPTLRVVDCAASGGSSGLTDPVLVAAARAYAIGQFGPTDGAILAGCLQQQSVRHFAAFPANDLVPYAQVYVADESWGSHGPPSDTPQGWVAQVAQAFVNSFQGFGCRARFGHVVNLGITVTPTVVLASTDALNFTSDIDDAIRAAVDSYFNERADWYTWRLSTLRAVVSRADPRILVCSSVAVTDSVTGADVPEPPQTFGATWSDTLTHYYPIDSSIHPSYLPPQ